MRAAMLFPYFSGIALVLGLLQVVKERGLAHVILTGNERLVFELLEEHRELRGNTRFISIGQVGAVTVL